MTELDVKVEIPKQWLSSKATMITEAEMSKHGEPQLRQNKQHAGNFISCHPSIIKDIVDKPPPESRGM